MDRLYAMTKYSLAASLFGNKKMVIEFGKKEENRLRKLIDHGEFKIIYFPAYSSIYNSINGRFHVIKARKVSFFKIRPRWVYEVNGKMKTNGMELIIFPYQYPLIFLLTLVFPVLSLITSLITNSLYFLVFGIVIALIFDFIIHGIHCAATKYYIKDFLSYLDD